MSPRSRRSRILGGFGFLAIGLVVFAVACDDDDGYGYGNGGAGGGSVGGECGQFTSCGACTPVQGCGWCQASNGQGLCASDPDQCASASEFTWTWNPGGCLVTADASAITIEPAPVDGDGGPPILLLPEAGVATDSPVAPVPEASTADGPVDTDAADGS